ncbi:MAG: AraC family transcriptional regulator [Planctomycetota bacterium]
MATPREYLSVLLNTRLEVIEAREYAFAAGWHEPDARINASRLIFAVDGTLPYHVDGNDLTLRTGDALLVPAGVHRRWRVPDTAPVRLLWFRYGLPEATEPALPAALVQRKVDRDAAWAGVRRLVGLTERPTPLRLLEAQAEAKAALARFLASAGPLRRGRSALQPGGAGDHAVNHAVAFLNRHFARADAIEAMHERVELSPAYFRKLFRRQIGCSPRDFLTRRRMQQARYRLLTGRAPIKRVAAEVGYNDPLYFSRLYTQHWGHPPSADDRRRW